MESKEITGYSHSSGRLLIPEDRRIDDYSGLTFVVEYDQEVYPFQYYGVGDIKDENVADVVISTTIVFVLVSSTGSHAVTIPAQNTHVGSMAGSENSSNVVAVQ